MISGTIFDIKKFAIHDGPGLRTTVFFKGCPLDCWACHNPEGKEKRVDVLVRSERCTFCRDCLDLCEPNAISLNGGKSLTLNREACEFCGKCIDVCLPGALQIAGREVTSGEVLEEIKKDVVFYDRSGGGATFSGGEPLSQPEFLLELLRECKKIEVSTVVDTSGVAPLELLAEVADWANLFLYDLKLVDDTRHNDFTGSSNTEILSNLEWLVDNDKKVIVRFPLFPGVNDDDANVSALGEFVNELPKAPVIDILPYHRAGIDKYERLGFDYRMPGITPPSEETTEQIAKTLRNKGLRVTVRGQAHDDE